MEKQESTFFVGEFHRSIDEKGRLTIPAGWRPKNSHNGNDVYCLALPTPDGNITVYPPKMVAQLEARISQVSIGDIEGQKAITELMSMAHSLNCDRQGRINLNERLIATQKSKRMWCWSENFQRLVYLVMKDTKNFSLRTPWMRVRRLQFFNDLDYSVYLK